MWYDKLWLDIQFYLDNLDEFKNDDVLLFLDKVESNIRCKKCKTHFKKFRERNYPENFSSKNDVVIWFDNLKFDIKNQKNKSTNIKVNQTSNRIKKRPVKRSEKIIIKKDIM